MSADASSEPKEVVIDLIESPPRSVFGIITRLGPGLVIAGSIVGSGELIATTSTGAKAGFWLLWLIIIGCVIKVFVQVEFGRYSIATGQGTMQGLEQVPGPRIPGRGNWLVWYWVLMFCASLAQLGGIVGGVGQALAISAPLTASGRAYNEQMETETRYYVATGELKLAQKEKEVKANRIQQLERSMESSELAQEQAKYDAARNELKRTKEEFEKQQTKIQLLQPQIAKLSTQFFKYRDEQIQALLLALPPNNGNKSKRVEAVESAIAIANQRRKRFPDQPELVFVTAAQLGAEMLAEKKTAHERAQLGREKAVPFNKEEAKHQIDQQLKSLKAPLAVLPKLGQRTAYDDKYWAAIIAIATAIILYIGHYGLIQTFSTFMVATFTVITVVNLVALQGYGEWAVAWTDIRNGLSFRLPPSESGDSAGLRAALFTFGIIGVGASELIAYPYWCLEKGYARFTGPIDKSQAWANRARGWLRVMRWDAWCSMVVYTFATIAFYLLGAAILGRIGLRPAGTEMIRTLSLMYAPVFGPFTQLLFLFGAFAVLYSTFFVANAGQARMCADAIRVTGLSAKNHATYRRNVRWLSGLFPLVCLTIYCLVSAPVALVMLSGLMQAMMLPMLCAAALYFRYFRCDSRIVPSVFWDVFLWASAVGMLITGTWAGYKALFGG